MNRADCELLDAQDPLAALREQFTLPAGKIYLDGNSLGAMPRATAARVAQVVQHEWGQHLIESWNTAHWIELPQRVGNKIARLVGAGPNELVVADSTSVNLFKVLSAALSIAQADAPQRRVILSERDNFPTDLYIAQSLARERGFELTLVEAPEDVEPQLARGDVAVLMLTQVNYRNGRVHDMAALTASAHRAGALVVWDLAHSAGALPVHLKRDDADFAVGCGYKYLNGGPGAPAFVWVHPRHAERFAQPLSGWMGHAAPFAFVPGYQPAPGIARYLCGTPPVLSLAALECGVDTVLAAEPLGGIDALRSKSLALTAMFMRLIDQRCAGQGLTLITPHDAHHRGSQVSYAREEREGGGGYAIVQALIARGVVGDFRAPDVLRFGFTPLYIRFVDVWDAVEHLRQVLESGEWQQARFNKKAAVT
jgi:kynureninase